MQSVADVLRSLPNKYWKDVSVEGLLMLVDERFVLVDELDDSAHRGKQIDICEKDVLACRIAEAGIFRVVGEAGRTYQHPARVVGRIQNSAQQNEHVRFCSIAEIYIREPIFDEDEFDYDESDSELRKIDLPW